MVGLFRRQSLRLLAGNAGYEHETKSDIDMEKYRLRRFVDRLITMDEVEISF